MKYCKILYAATVFMGIFIFNAGFALADEQVDNFDATIRINADASIEVAERINYNFENLQRHGIYRDIPVKYAARGGNYNLRVSDVFVRDEDGNICDFEVSAIGDYERIKIGNAGTFVSGRKTYLISYKIGHAINYFADHDELYWNVTGNGWNVPIVNASAKIIFPQNLAKEEVRLSCYGGSTESRDVCSFVQYTPANDYPLVSGAEFGQHNLSPLQGLTIAVGIPAGIMQKPTFFASLADIISDNLIMLFPLLVLTIMFCLWWMKGRDPKGRGTIIPEFEAPDGLTPAEAGTIVDERCGQKEIMAEIINLAVKGYLKIRREEKEILFIKSADYVFEKLKDSADLSEPFDRELMNGIFTKGDKVKFSELRGNFYMNYNSAVKNIYASVYAKGYFSKDPRKVIVKYTGLVVFVSAAMFLVQAIGGYNIGGYIFFAFISSILLIIFFAYAMPQRTKQGVLMKEYILGLKNYITVAEKDRLEFHNAPDKNPEQFEKLLPYAIALGVEKEWAKQFEGIYNASPSWYEDSRGFNNFSAVYFINDLGGVKTSFASLAAPASSGGSGLGGGGFSGGGFGGGGGGSW